METHYTTSVPCVKLYDVESYAIEVLGGANPSGIRAQKYVNARTNLQVDIDKFYLWLYRSIWDCELKISGSCRIPQEIFPAGSGGGINYYTRSIRSVVKVGSVQHGRDRKIAITNASGRTSLIDDPSNQLPKGYPKEILYKIRSNPCYLLNGSTVYFDCFQRIENLLFDIQYSYRPPPTPNFSSREDVSITTKQYGIFTLYLVSWTLCQPVKCEIYLNPGGTTVYHYTRKKYIPSVTFGYSSPADWIGLYDSEENSGSEFTSKSALSVDGISIPSSTVFDFGQGEAVSGQLNINLDWKISKQRDP